MTNNEGKEIEVIPEPKEVAPIADDQLLAVAEQAEKRIEAINRIKRLVLRVTNANDWTDQGGKPYLAVSGAEKVGRLFGISWRMIDEEPKLVYEESGHFRYEYRGFFTLGGATIEAIGVRSSKDPFFSRNKGTDVPPSAIDMGDVKKAAFTNCIGNGVTRLLGIRNMTWEELAEAKIDRSKVTKIEYKTGGKSQLIGKITEPQIKLIHTLLGKKGITEADYKGVLEQEKDDEGKPKYGVKTSKDLTKEQASEIIERLGKQADVPKETQPEPEEEDTFADGEKQ